MKYKKSIIVIMLAIFIFSIAAVSASDVNDTVIASEDIGQMELSAGNELAMDYLQVNEDNTTLIQTKNDVSVNGEIDSEAVGADTGSYSGLSSEIGYGGNIKLQHDYYTYDSGSTISISHANSVIDGNGAVIDMAGSTIRAFSVSASGVIIKNLTIKNVNYNGNGGAIYFSSSGTVENCNFINNTATGDNSYGGAVYFSSSGTVENCNFINNTATGDYSYGGAVYFYSNGNVANCNFINNKVTGDYNYGGAIYFSSSGTTHEVRNCNFSNNTASNGDGGVIYFNNHGEVTKCNFSNNKARWSGAIYFRETGNVTNCNFTNNNVSFNGGAIKIFSGSVTNCNFVNNSANIGGAIYFSSSGTVTNCSFTNNKARWGGAIDIDLCTVTNCNFINNSASEEGGAIRFSSSGTVTNCNFTGNNATAGSAIYFWDTSDINSVSNSCLLNNRANAETLEVAKNDNNITIIFTGNNNLLNAIYSRNDAEVTFTNVTYWSANVIANTGSSPTTPTRSNKEAGQNITVSVVVNDILVLNKVITTDENGMIVLDIIAGDNYYIRARHDTDSYYTEAETVNSTMKFNVNVTSQTTNNKTVNITAKSNIPDEVINGKLLFILPDGTSDGMVIKANYAGNGTWWAEHTFDAYGEYKVNATYVGLDNVTVNNATITVNKIKTELSGNAITTTYNINKDLIITLKDSNGNPVSGAKLIVDLNGAKTYTTDKNGQVKVSTKGLAPKTYTAKVTFNGDTNYDKSTKDIKVTVKKATPKLTAKKKTFKATTKTKKYTIILKDNTGKAIKKAKVTLKVKGKTYKATTNSKGKAVFKIKNLKKKGTFKATITYKGNKYYNKVSKKANIKVIVTFKTVSKGSKDKSTVKEIQQALKDHGYYLSYKGHYLKVDGKFQSCTERSVKEFQHDKGLKVTGKVDEKTAKKLGLI